MWASDQHFNQVKKSLEKMLNEIEQQEVSFDDHSVFPHLFFDMFYRYRLHTLTIGEAYGGKRFGLESICKVILQVAQVCPSAALCAAMHFYTIGVLDQVLTQAQKDDIYTDIWKNGHYMASFNQPNVTLFLKNQDYRHSTRITIIKERDGYVVNGIKPYTSGAVRFKYFPIFGFQDGVKTKFGLTALMLSKNDPGIEIIDDWKLSGMRSTLSHTLQFHNVRVPADRLIGREGLGIEDTMQTVFWSRATISAVYLGIASSVIQYIRRHLKEKRDRISDRSAAFLPGNQYAVADMLIQYETAYNQLFSFARHVDSGTCGSDQLMQSAAVTKSYIDHVSNSIVTSAMNLQGISALMEGGFLEKCYRDVKAASFHQPSDLLLKEMLAKRFLGIFPGKTRWV